MSIFSSCCKNKALITELDLKEKKNRRVKRTNFRNTIYIR